MTSLYSHDIILVLFQWIIEQDYKNKYLVTGDWSKSTDLLNIVEQSSANKNTECLIRLQEFAN